MGLRIVCQAWCLTGWDFTHCYRYARNVEHLDIAEVVADLDARGFFTSIFRAAIIIERKIWATVMLWEHGVTFDTLQEMLEAGQLEDE